MYLSVQLSYYPLTDNYKPPIKALIQRLENSGLEVHSNRMSTQIFGEYDTVMNVFSETLRWSFETYGKAVFTANFIEGDRRPRD
ncbi:YkoF family thiamine/hydroxymethylpyrimidine-binding protein [Marinobacter sp. 1Y8]